MKIVLEIGQELWFTSDCHYNHAAICAGTATEHLSTTRLFESLEEMNDTLVNNINAFVKEDDVLFDLGDWSFGGFEQIEKFRKRIKCKTIYKVLGNHDHLIEKNKDGIQALFASVDHYVELDLRRKQPGGTVKKEKYILCHFPIASWKDMKQGVIHLHGHVHLPSHKRIGKGRSMDVGVDGNFFYPIKATKIRALLRDRPVANLVLPQDHHTKNTNEKNFNITKGIAWFRKIFFR